MKIRISYIISVIILLQLITPSAIAQNLPDGEVDITIKQLSQKRELLYLNFNLDISNTRIKSNQALSYTPTISTSTKTVSFPEIVVRGRSNYKAYIRKMALTSEKESSEIGLLSYYTAIKAFGSDEEFIDYEYVIPYENWMAKSKLVMDAKMITCGDTVNLKSETFGSPIASKRGFLRESLFRRNISKFEGDLNVLDNEKVGEVFKIYFPSNVSKIQKRYLDNADELKRLRSLIRIVRKPNDFTITRIVVVGYTSVGASYATNQILSYARAKSVYDYLSRYVKINSSLIDVYFAGANWGELKNAVVQYDLPEKRSVLDIINNEQIGKERISELKFLNGGDTYRYMRETLFPQLQYVYIKVYVDKIIR